MKAIALFVVTAAFMTGPVKETPSATVVTSAFMKQDPADSLYRVARDAMSKGQYSNAASIFGRIASQYPNSSIASEAMYYQAFSLYRMGGDDRLKSARDVLTKLREKNPSFAKGEPANLRTRICGELAQRGDAVCAAEVTKTALANDRADAAADAADRASDAADRAADQADRAAERADARSAGRKTASSAGCPDADDDDDERVAALNALLQMDSDRAMPILTKVLDRRDACSAGLRRKAVFLVSQKRTPQTADLLMKIAGNDPDEEVRQQAVFWLSQVPDERAVDMLQQILNTSKDEELQNKAIFAISQHRSGRGNAILRDYAMRDAASTELRGQAIFWLGQRNGTDNNDFLRTLYSRLNDDDLKEKVLFSLSQRKNQGNEKWLMDIAVNSKENIELRKKALFWAGQSGVGIDAIAPLYSQIGDKEMKEQVIFVLSQRSNSPAAMDKLIDIAKNDKDPDLRKKAIFWLGQSRDPRAQQLLLDIINK